MENDNNKPKERLDWDKRKLCSDPACIGVIGPDNRCKECGKPYQGDPFADTPLDPSGAASDDTLPEGAAFETGSADGYDNSDDDDSDDDAEYADEEETVSDSDWKDRKLCSDPACIGVIGADGRCKECGKAYKGK
jgi:hypothetical protein